METKRIGRKRLSVDIPSGVHQALKFQAVKQNCTVTKIILKSVIEYMKKTEADLLTTT